MKKHKKRVGIVLVSFLCIFSGCSKKEETRIGIADNEILTLAAIPQDKQTFTMRFGDGMDAERIIDAIETKFPEVNIVPTFNTSISLNLKNDSLEDIVLSSIPEEYRSAPAGTYIDLSGEDYISNYYLAVLNTCEQDGHLYYLPGPSTVTGVVYNKVMFEEHGWEIPHSLDEFITLCKEIEATGIRALQPTLKYKTAVRLLFAGFTYSSSFAGVDGYQWLNEYQQGTTNMVGHMEKSMGILQRLLDAGIWRSEDFQMEPGERTQMMYKDKTTAMILETQMAPNYANRYGGNSEDIAMMPFYSGNEPGDDYLIADPCFYMGLNSRLEEKGNEQRLQLAKDIFAYISTPQGQADIISKDTPLISNVIGYTSKQSEFLAQVQKTIEEGRVVYTPYYWGNINTSIDNVFYDKLSQFAQGKATISDVLRACDKARDELLAKVDLTGTQLGTAKQNFSKLETGLYIADAFRYKADAQIGINLVNTRQSGTNIRFNKGAIYSGVSASYGSILEISYKADKNDTTLQKVKMTGAQIQNVLNVISKESLKYKDSYYVASGLDIEFAPWAKDGERLIQVTLEDGSALEDDTLYTVALWQGAVDDTFLTSIEETYQYDIVSILQDTIQRDGGMIQPFDDDRFVLNWDIIYE